MATTTSKKTSIATTSIISKKASSRLGGSKKKSALQEALIDVIAHLDPISDKDLILRVFRVYCIVSAPAKIKPIAFKNSIARAEYNLPISFSAEDHVCPKCGGDLCTMNIFPDSDFIDGGEYVECVECEWRTLSFTEARKSFTVNQLFQFIIAHNYAPVKFEFDILKRVQLEYRLELGKVTVGSTTTAGGESCWTVGTVQVSLTDEDIGSTYEYTLEEFKAFFGKFQISKMEVSEN